MKRMVLLSQVLLLLLTAEELPAQAVPPRATPDVQSMAVQPASAGEAKGGKLVIKTSERKLYFYDANNTVRASGLRWGGKAASGPASPPSRGW